MSEVTSPHALTTAIQLWKRGRRIPLTLFVELQALGYDVPTLERFYRR